MLTSWIITGNNVILLFTGTLYSKRKFITQLIMEGVDWMIKL